MAGATPVLTMRRRDGNSAKALECTFMSCLAVSVDGGAFQAGPTIVQGTSTTFAIPFTSPAAPKLQEVCVRARDVRGTLSTPTCVLIAWFDVAAGFATGDLTLPSPAGAYVADEDLEGTALLNLNTKYKKNGTVPEGATTFSFLAAGLEFTSTSYDWLVISGNLVQLRASGTINGTGNYQILVTARDNGNSSPKTDAVRIRIVDASGGSIIYDNQPGAPETAEVKGLGHRTNVPRRRLARQPPCFEAVPWTASATPRAPAGAISRRLVHDRPAVRPS